MWLPVRQLSPPEATQVSGRLTSLARSHGEHKEFLAAVLSWLKQVCEPSTLIQASDPIVTLSVSSLNTSRESEQAMECRLDLTTLSGTVVEMSTGVAQYDRLEDFEDHV